MFLRDVINILSSEIRTVNTISIVFLCFFKFSFFQ